MRKNLLLGVATLSFLAVGSQVQAQYYVAGAFQGWDPGNATYQMTDMGGGHYQYIMTGQTAGSVQEFKITSGGWADPNYPSSNVTGIVGTNGEMQIDFWDNDSWADGWLPADQRRIGYTSDATASWSIIGQSGFGFGDWGTGTDGPSLTHQGNQVYSAIIDITNTGDAEFKFRQTGTWDGYQFSWDGGKDGNIMYNFANTGLYEFTIDTANGRYDVEVVPEPATMTLLGLGALAALRRKKKKA